MTASPPPLPASAVAVLYLDVISPFAYLLDARLRRSVDFLGIEPNPIPVKALLERFGIGHGLRLPLTPLSPQHAESAASIAAEIRGLESSCRDAIAA